VSPRPPAFQPPRVPLHFVALSRRPQTSLGPNSFFNTLLSLSLLFELLCSSCVEIPPSPYWAAPRGRPPYTRAPPARRPPPSPRAGGAGAGAHARIVRANTRRRAPLPPPHACTVCARRPAPAAGPPMAAAVDSPMPHRSGRSPFPGVARDCCLRRCGRRLGPQRGGGGRRVVSEGRGEGGGGGGGGDWGLGGLRRSAHVSSGAARAPRRPVARAGGQRVDSGHIARGLHIQTPHNPQIPRPLRRLARSAPSSPSSRRDHRAGSPLLPAPVRALRVGGGARACGGARQRSRAAAPARARRAAPAPEPSGAPRWGTSSRRRRSWRRTWGSCPWS
jgi:hypothetical protein